MINQDKKQQSSTTRQQHECDAKQQQIPEIHHAPPRRTSQAHFSGSPLNIWTICRMSGLDSPALPMLMPVDERQREETGRPRQQGNNKQQQTTNAQDDEKDSTKTITTWAKLWSASNNKNRSRRAAVRWPTNTNKLPCCTNAPTRGCYGNNNNDRPVLLLKLWLKA